MKKMLAMLLALVGCLRAASPPVVPFTELLARPVNIRPELRGVHPHLFFTQDALGPMRARAHGVDRELWSSATRKIRAMAGDPPAALSPELDKSGFQNDLGLGIAQAAFVYAIDRDPKVLAAAKRWMMAVTRYPDWGYSYRTPNLDLPPAYLLYGLSFAYDLLYSDLTPDERTAIRTKLVRQARLMYEGFKYRAGHKYTFAQNHTFIPMTGLAMAGFALTGEEPEAAQWLQLTRAIYDRTLLCFDTDGYYYEGFHYAAYSLHWIVRYLDALRENTGEDLYPGMKERFTPLKLFIAHSVLPDGVHAFDFGDTGRGAAERNEAPKESLDTGYEILYRFAAEYHDAQAQGIADWLRRDLHGSTYEDIWAFFAHDPSVSSTPAAQLTPYHYFEDAGVVFWRSGWGKDATAIAFRCGPPEGHHVLDLMRLIPEWKINTGHSHPDANSFILFAHGKYLTGDTGYTGIKMAQYHNAVLVDGKGEDGEGRHEMFDGVPYKRLDLVRLSDVKVSSDGIDLRGEASAAYPPAMGLTRFERHFVFHAPDRIEITDQLEAAQPHVYTWLLESDRDLASVQGGADVRNESVVLHVKRLEPERAVSKIVPLVVVDQGRPGSVEDGKPDRRGLQLQESTPEPAKSALFVHDLVF